MRSNFTCSIRQRNNNEANINYLHFDNTLMAVMLLLLSEVLYIKRNLVTKELDV